MASMIYTPLTRAELAAGRELENAHTALADVQACMAVYFAIKGS